MKEKVNLYKSIENSSSVVHNGTNEDYKSDGADEDDVQTMLEDDEKAVATRRSTQIRESNKTRDESEDSNNEDDISSSDEGDASELSDTNSENICIPESTQKSLQKAMKIFSKVSHFGKKVGNERLSTRVGRISQNVRSLGKEPRFQEPVTKKPKMTGAEFHDMTKQQTKRKKTNKEETNSPPKNHKNKIETGTFYETIVLQRRYLVIE